MLNTSLLFSWKPDTLTGDLISMDLGISDISESWAEPSFSTCWLLFWLKLNFYLTFRLYLEWIAT